LGEDGGRLGPALGEEGGRCVEGEGGRGCGDNNFGDDSQRIWDGERSGVGLGEGYFDAEGGLEVGGVGRGVL